MWTESSSVNYANLVNISATIPDIEFSLGGYFFWLARTLYIMLSIHLPNSMKSSPMVM